jgi:hypothetical protein
VSSDETDRLRAIERVLGRKISVLPLDRSGIRVPVAPAAQPRSSSHGAAIPQRGPRPPQHGQQRGHGQSEAGHGRRGGRGRGR